jgi:hypothetical protein
LPQLQENVTLAPLSPVGFFVIRTWPGSIPRNFIVSAKTGCIITKPHFFRVAYTFGGNFGFTRENAYMEAARCLRCFLARESQLLDKSVGIDVSIDDICDFIDFNDDDTVSSANTNTIQQQPVINIINSTVTIGNNNNHTYSNNVIYDDTNDEYEFIFEYFWFFSFSW